MRKSWHRSRFSTGWTESGGKARRLAALRRLNASKALATFFPDATGRGGRLEVAVYGGIFTRHFSAEVRDVDDVPLHTAGRADEVEVRRQDRDLLHLGIRRFARRLAAALRQGQEA